MFESSFSKKGTFYIHIRIRNTGTKAEIGLRSNLPDQDWGVTNNQLYIKPMPAPAEMPSKSERRPVTQTMHDS